jgi:carbamoyltransferase
LLAAGKIIGWYQGRMEFGPRALGNRSILADPQSPEMQQTLNLKIKFRETFRPFAPAVLCEKASDYFELAEPSPYMLMVAPVQPQLRRHVEKEFRPDDLAGRARALRSTIPAVTHVDFSARVQTVSRVDNPRFHRLLSAFESRTGCAVLINTSFNVRGEPPVCTPADAIRCFHRTDIDFLFLGNFLVSKSAAQRAAQKSLETNAVA